MTQNSELYEVKIAQRGGSGREALWEWGVYKKGGSLPLIKGNAQGHEAKALAEGERALARYKARLKA